MKYIPVNATTNILANDFISKSFSFSFWYGLLYLCKAINSMMVPCANNPCVLYGIADTKISKKIKINFLNTWRSISSLCRDHPKTFCFCWGLSKIAKVLPLPKTTNSGAPIPKPITCGCYPNIVYHNPPPKNTKDWQSIQILAVEKLQTEFHWRICQLVHCVILCCS